MVKILAIGGESLILLVREHALERYTVLKIARPDVFSKANLKINKGALFPWRMEVKHTSDMCNRWLRGHQLQNEIRKHIIRDLKSNLLYVPIVLYSRVNPLLTLLEYVHGESLYEYFCTPEISLIGRLKAYYKLLKAVEYIHGLGVVHSDLNPNNILVQHLDESGDIRIIIIDWGLAKAIGGVSYTKFGVGFGHPTYSSPQQQSDASHRTYRDDIYTIGLIMWMALKGRPLPYIEYLPREKKIGDYLLERMHEIEEEPFRQLFRKATHLNQESRYQIMNDFVKDFEIVCKRTYLWNDMNYSPQKEYNLEIDDKLATIFQLGEEIQVLKKMLGLTSVYEFLVNKGETKDETY